MKEIAPIKHLSESYLPSHALGLCMWSELAEDPVLKVPALRIKYECDASPGLGSKADENNSITEASKSGAGRTSGRHV